MAAQPVKSGYVSNGPDLLLNYLEWGDPSAPSVVLIHGLSGIAYNWSPTGQALADRYRVIALSLRGHGESGPSPEGEYNFQLYATDVNALVSGLQLDRPVVIGHSLGGRVSMAYAAAHPADTRGIVVVDVAPGITDAGVQSIKQGMVSRPDDWGTWEEALAWLKQRRASVSNELVAERAPHVFRRLSTGRYVTKGDPWVRSEWLGAELPPRAKAHLWKELGEVQCPVLVLKGEDTPYLTPELCEEMRQTIKGNSRWAEVPGTTHGIPDDNLLGFLKEIEPFLAENLSR